MKKNLCSMIMALGFLLGIHGGNIALWNDTDPEPIKVFPYKASLLPLADQALLERGVRVKDLDELKQLVEDYLS